MRDYKTTRNSKKNEFKGGGISLKSRNYNQDNNKVISKCITPEIRLKLTPWEVKFIKTISTQTYKLTVKQNEILAKIFNKYKTA